MSAQSVALLAEQTVAAGGPGASKSIPTLSMGHVYVSVSGTGTVLLDVWLEASSDGGTTWYDVPYDLQLKTTGAATGGTPGTDGRDIVPAKASTTAERFLAVYKHLAADLVRLNWTLTGGGTVTMRADLIGK